MADYAVGQRWLSETETELGLGIIEALDHRLITVLYPASEETRTYARNNNPLSRLSYKAGDIVSTVTGDQVAVADVSDVDGVLIYHVTADDADETTPLPETLLSHEVVLNHASDRLFSKQIDKPRWFELRHAALSAQEHLQASSVQGLVGPRVDFIEHQFYIAEAMHLAALCIWGVVCAAVVSAIIQRLH